MTAKILVIRRKKVMLDRDLAELYEVTTGELNQAVRRHRSRFPDDFMYQLTHEELANLKSQIVISSWGGTRSLPYVFTEQGIAMLSSVLNSERAVQVNILIMRAFVKLRDFLLTHKELAEKIDALEHKYTDHDKKFSLVFEAIRQLLQPPVQDKPPIGFQKETT